MNECGGFCPQCGTPANGNKTADGTTTALLVFLSVLFPMAGLKMYFAWRDKDPVLVKKCLKAAIITWAVQAALAVLFAFVLPVLIVLLGAAAPEAQTTLTVFGPMMAA